MTAQAIFNIKSESFKNIKTKINVSLWYSEKKAI